MAAQIVLQIPLGELGGIQIPGLPLPGGGHPDHSLPGSGARPDHSLPGSGARPDNTLPPVGGQPVPPTTLPIPPIPPELASQTIVAVHRPGHDWVVRAYTPGTLPDQGLPPTAEPKPVG